MDLTAGSRASADAWPPRPGQVGVPGAPTQRDTAGAEGGWGTAAAEEGDWSAPPPPEPRKAAWNAPPAGASTLQQLDSEPEPIATAGVVTP